MNVEIIHSLIRIDCVRPFAAICCFFFQVTSNQYDKILKAGIKYSQLFQAVDNTNEASPALVQINAGGVNQRFIELKLTTKIGMGMKYLIQAYTKGSNLHRKSPSIH